MGNEYLHNGILLICKEINKFMKSANKPIEPENILSEKTQTQKEKLKVCSFPFMDLSLNYLDMWA